MHRWAASTWKLPAASGVLLILAYYAPLFVPNLVAFVPLLIWLDASPDASRLRRMAGGLILGLTTHFVTLSFTLELLRFTWLALLLYIGLTFAFAVKIAVMIAVAGWIRQRTGISWGVILPAVWIPVEYVQSYGDLRMTADHVAYSLTPYPFAIQFADLVGSFGVGVVLLSVNGLIYEGLVRWPQREAKRSLVALVVLAGAILGYDLWAWYRPLEANGTFRVAVIQPDIPLLMKRDVAAEAEQSARLARMSLEAAELEPDLIVWPETARPGVVQHWLEHPTTFAMPEVQQLAVRTGASFVVGTEYYRIRSREDFDRYNAALAVHADGELDPRWVAKVHLVPFVEAMPFRWLLGPLVEGKGGEWRFVTGGFEPGPEEAVLEVVGTRVGVQVCYEQLFPDRGRSLKRAGAEVQVVITNDAWFGRTLFQGYQANVLRMRAIETRTDFVRAANTGISGFIDRRGRFHHRTRLFEPAVEVHEVARASGSTLYTRVGDLAAWSAILGLGLLCWWSRRAGQRI